MLAEDYISELYFCRINDVLLRFLFVRESTLRGTDDFRHYRSPVKRKKML